MRISIVAPVSVSFRFLFNINHVLSKVDYCKFSVFQVLCISAYAEKLTAAGVPNELILIKGALHGYFNKMGEAKK